MNPSPGNAAPSRRPTVLIVDDDALLLDQLSMALEDSCMVVTARDRAGAVARFREAGADVALVDLHLPPRVETIDEGIATLEALKAADPDLAVVVVTGERERSIALEVIRRGADDYFEKPFDLNALEVVVGRGAQLSNLRRELSRLRRAVESRATATIIGSTPAMRAVVEMVHTVAPSDVSVLLHGESGTGKELVARAIHQLSARARGPFVTLDCTALAESLIESELFGHRRGAFTGAVADRRGRVELAQGGTLFLDEIGDLSASGQAKLLRLIEGGELTRVGSDRTLHVDVRVVAASHHKLSRLVEEGRFRDDLYYRLNVVEIELPPLRERIEDIPLLARHILERLAGERAPRTLSPGAMACLTAHRWPGNVRELEHALERACVVAAGPVIEPRHLPEEVRAAAPAAGVTDWLRLPPGGLRLAEVERELIRRTLERYGGNRTRAAAMLGLTRQSLLRRIHAHGLGEGE